MNSRTVGINIDLRKACFDHAGRKHTYSRCSQASVKRLLSLLNKRQAQFLFEADYRYFRIMSTAAHSRSHQQR